LLFYSVLSWLLRYSSNYGHLDAGLSKFGTGDLVHMKLDLNAHKVQWFRNGKAGVLVDVPLAAQYAVAVGMQEISENTVEILPLQCWHTA
jgi:hypothetical protein